MCHLLHEVFGDLPPLHSQGIFMIFYFAISFVSGVFKLYKGKDYVLPFSMPPVLPCTQAGSQYPFVELQWIFPWGTDLGSAPFISGKKKKKKDIKALINFWYELPTFEWKDKQGKVRREFEATWKRSIFTADQ